MLRTSCRRQLRFRRTIDPARVELRVVFFVEIDSRLVPVEHLPDHSAEAAVFHLLQQPVEKHFPQTHPTHFFGHDDVFEIEPLAFPGAVTDIVKGESFNSSSNSGDKGPPDGMLPETAVFEMLW